MSELSTPSFVDTIEPSTTTSPALVWVTVGTVDLSPSRFRFWTRTPSGRDATALSAAACAASMSAPSFVATRTPLASVTTSRGVGVCAGEGVVFVMPPSKFTS